MSFSQGFSNTFRSIDGANQWRATLGENARQFDETLDETQRVNDSRIDLNGAQIRRLDAATRLVDQEFEHNGQMNPLKLENQQLVNTGQGLANDRTSLLNSAQQLINRENAATSATRVEQQNSQARLAAFQAKLQEFQGRNGASRELLEIWRRPDGMMMSPEEIVQNPQEVPRFIAAVTASSELTEEGFGEDDIAVVHPKIENGQVVGYYTFVDDGTGKLRPDPDYIDESGQPVAMSVEEMTQVVGNLMNRLDLRASHGGLGGSTRSGIIEAKAGERARVEAGPAPSAQPTPQGYEGRALGDLRAEGEGVAAELEQVLAQQEAIRQQIAQRELSLDDWGNTMLPSSALRLGPSEEQQTELATLNEQAANLERRLGDIGRATQSAEYNSTLGARQAAHQQAVGQRTRTLAGSIQRNETLNQAPYTAEGVDNMLATGRANFSAADQQAALVELSQDLADDIKDFAVVDWQNSSTGRWSSDSRERAGSEMAAQLEAMITQNADMQAIAQSPGGRSFFRQMGMMAMDLAGSDGKPNLQLAYGLMSESVEGGAERLGAVIRKAAQLLNPDGGPTAPEWQAEIGNAAIELLNGANGNESADALAQRIVLRFNNGR